MTTRSRSWLRARRALEPSRDRWGADASRIGIFGFSREGRCGRGRLSYRPSPGEGSCRSKRVPCFDARPRCWRRPRPSPIGERNRLAKLAKPLYSVGAKYPKRQYARSGGSPCGCASLTWTR
jgi:hypothetical protein